MKPHLCSVSQGESVMSVATATNYLEVILQDSPPKEEESENGNGK
jgi:hypothetical protein